MKHTLFILALITATIQTFAQSPRIKLNQITKDSLTGSVLISSPTDSGMVYSRDLFITYGADTFLILGGDTLAATSSIIHSVLSDGVTITGDGTIGSKLTVDTVTVIATKGDLNNIDLTSQVTGTLPIANGGTGSDTLNFVDLITTQTVGGAKTFTNNFTTNGGSVKLGTNNWPTDNYLEANGRILVNATSAPLLVWKQDTFANNPAFVQLGQTKGGTNGTEQIRGGAIAGGYEGEGNNGYLSLLTTPNSNVLTERVRIDANGNVGINETSPSARLDVNGNTELNGALIQSGGDINFNSNTFFVDESENRVGIGTSSPSAKLDVLGDMNVNGDLTLTAGFFEPLILRRDIALNLFSVQMPLQLKNNAGNYVTYAAIRGVIRDTTTSLEDGDIQFHTMLNGNVNYAFEIRNNGNVGINLLNIESDPTEKLDVNGNARFRSIGSGASAGALHRTSNGTLTTNTSDLRLKTNINPLENTLEKLLNVNTYTFNWINESDRVDLGMIAQEVEEIFPRLVFTNPVDGYKGIHYDKFSSILTKAIQEQQAIIETQASEIETLKSQIQLILSEIEQIKNN